MPKNKKNKKPMSKAKRIGLFAVGIIAFTSVPVMAAVIVQNFITGTVTVNNPPIVKLAGADANVSSFLTVDLGQTISNNDSLLPTSGGSDTLLSNEQITFACFSGDRSYYMDVMQLQNTTAAEDWDVTLTIEDDLQGNAALSQTFTDTAADGGDADIWLFVSEGDTTTTPVAQRPNPGSYTTLTDWYDNDAGDAGVQAIQLEITSSAFSTTTGQFTTGSFTIPAGEQRQIAIVADCGANMQDEVAAGTTGTLRMTVESEM